MSDVHQRILFHCAEDSVQHLFITVQATKYLHSRMSISWARDGNLLFPHPNTCILFCEDGAELIAFSLRNHLYTGIDCVYYIV